METQDNIIDFNRLIINNINEDDYTYKWKQYREVKPREGPTKGTRWVSDPIVKAVFVFFEDYPDEGERGLDFNYSLVLRKSGNVDFYWNMFLVDSSTNRKDTSIFISIF